MDNMNELLNLEGLDLLTDAEKGFNAKYVEKLKDYADGKGDGVHMRNLTSGAATIAKRQQSRSAVAVLKWSMVQKGVLTTITDQSSADEESKVEQQV